jgi:predicted dehydrogenase
MLRENEPMTTRREFLKTSALAGASLSLLANAHAGGSDEIRVGIIGCGDRGSGAADNVLHAAPHAKIVAIGDVFGFRVKGLRQRLLELTQSDEVKKLGNGVDLPEDRCCVGLDCHQRVLDSGINYVILTSPPGFRPVHLEAAVKKGVHIFTEKPVAVDGPGVRKVLAAYDEAVAKNLRIAAGTQRRHQTGYLETMKRVHDGAIGDIRALRCYWNGTGIWFRPRSELTKLGERDCDLAYQLHNWYHFVWTCGDHIAEQHVHNLDVCNWAMGDRHPVRCIGVGCRSARPVGKPEEVGHIFDQFAIEYEYENGANMFSMCRQVPGSDGNFQGASGVSEALVGSKGTCRTADHHQYVIKGATDWSFNPRQDNAPYVQEHTDLIESIRTGKPLNELKNVAESTLTAVMGRMAAYTGKVVTWDKALGSKQNTMPDHLAWDMPLPVPPVAVPGRTALV